MWNVFCGTKHKLVNLLTSDGGMVGRNERESKEIQRLKENFGDNEYISSHKHS